MLTLFIIAAIAYAFATLAYGVEREDPSGHRPPLAKAARPALGIAALLHFLAIGAQCVEGDHPLKNIYLATSFAAFIVELGYLGLSRGHRLDSLGPFMAAVGLVGLVLGVLFSAAGGDELPARETLTSAHVVLATTGFAGFTLAAGVAGVYLAMERRLRRKKFRPGEQGMSLTGLDRLHYRLVLVVTPVFTLAIATGVLFVLQIGGLGMLKDRAFELAAAAVAWLASTGLLAARAVWGTRGRVSARLTLVAFTAVLLIVGYYGVRT
jgi:ABC-type uncharacterized transport system permease subunit